MAGIVPERCALPFTFLCCECGRWNLAGETRVWVPECPPGENRALWASTGYHTACFSAAMSVRAKCGVDERVPLYELYGKDEHARFYLQRFYPGVAKRLEAVAVEADGRIGPGPGQSGGVAA